MDRFNSGQGDAVASQIQRMRWASRGELVGKLWKKKHCYKELKPKRMKRGRREEAVKRTMEQSFDSLNVNTAFDMVKTRGDS